MACSVGLFNPVEALRYRHDKGDGRIEFFQLNVFVANHCLPHLSDAIHRLVIDVLRSSSMASPGELVSWLNHLMLGASPDELLARLKHETVSLVCAKAFRPGEPAYQCLTCGVDPTVTRITVVSPNQTCAIIVL